MVRRGGCVLAQDFDSDLTVIDAADQSLERHTDEVLDAAVPNPWIRRQRFGLFHRVGLTDVRVVPHTTALTGASGFEMYQQLDRGTITRAMTSGRIRPDQEGTVIARRRDPGGPSRASTSAPDSISPSTDPAHRARARRRSERVLPISLTAQAGQRRGTSHEMAAAGEAEPAHAISRGGSPRTRR
jgi:hypothetical protein